MSVSLRLTVYSCAVTEGVNTAKGNAPIASTAPIRAIDRIRLLNVSKIVSLSVAALLACTVEANAESHGRAAPLQLEGCLSRRAHHVIQFHRIGGVIKCHAVDAGNKIASLKAQHLELLSVLAGGDPVA